MSIRWSRTSVVNGCKVIFDRPGTWSSSSGRSSAWMTFTDKDDVDKLKRRRMFHPVYAIVWPSSVSVEGIESAGFCDYCGWGCSWESSVLRVDCPGSRRIWLCPPLWETQPACSFDGGRTFYSVSGWFMRTLQYYAVSTQKTTVGIFTTTTTSKFWCFSWSLDRKVQDLLCVRMARFFRLLTLSWTRNIQFLWNAKARHQKNNII